MPNNEQNDLQHGEISTWIHDYKEGLGHFRELMPDVANKYLEFTGACFKAGEINAKTKQLIALGISLGLQDEYCMVYHTQEAIHCGANREEILEVVGVSAAFAGGGAMSQGVTLILECLEELQDQGHYEYKN